MEFNFQYDHSSMSLNVRCSGVTDLAFFEFFKEQIELNHLKYEIKSYLIDFREASPGFSVIELLKLDNNLSRIVGLDPNVPIIFLHDPKSYTSERVNMLKKIFAVKRRAPIEIFTHYEKALTRVQYYAQESHIL